MERPGLRTYNCVLCSKKTKPCNRRFLFGEKNRKIRSFLNKTFFLNCVEHDVICNKCRQKYYFSLRNKQSQALVQTDVQTNDPDYEPPPTKQRKQHLSSPPSIALPIQSLGGSHSQCFVCKRRGPKLVVVSSEAKYDLFIKRGVLVPPGTRCCPVHIQDGKAFSQDSVERISEKPTNTSSNFNRTGLNELIEDIRTIALRNDKNRINFDSGTSLKDADYLNLTGLTRNDFDDVCSHLDTTMRDTRVRSIRTCIGLFLTKLRSGMSNRLLSTVFNIGISSVRRAVASGRNVLSSQFVPKHLGFQHISRENIIEKHTRPLAQELFGSLASPPAILVVDGTYIYIQKSDQFSFQRRCYSMFKHRPLVKPMVIVSTTGYFVSVVGPYFSDAKNNDSKILNHILRKNTEEIKSWLQENDVMVVDRGFRDSLELLTDLGIKTHMPKFLKKGQKQYTCEEANLSRLVTKIRWVVESANARIKMWKYLSNVIPTNQVPHIGDYVKIVCSLCNKYFQPLSHGEQQQDLLVASKMLYLSKQKNSLQERVCAEGLDKRSAKWEKMTGTRVVVNFPILSEDDLRDITLGVYQVKLAKGYTTEHLDESGDYEIFVSQCDDQLLQARIQSRHTSSKQHKLWVHYDESRVISWYCLCKAGARVVGTCAHISSVLWYLGYYRHQDELSLRPYVDFASHIEDAQNVEVIDESDVSDVEE